MRATYRLVLGCALLAACKSAPTTSATALPDAAIGDVSTPDAGVSIPDAGVSTPDAGAPSPDDLSATLEPIRARRHLPALAAAVFDGQRMLAQGAVGQRAIDDPAAVQTDDRWHLGSCTKAMTATLLARLVERGVVRWETTLAEAFPDVAESMSAAYRSVTLEQLLQHRSGLPGGDIAPELWNPLWRPGNVLAQRRAFVAAILSRPPATPPGTAFAYANAGYMIVGAALERATGSSWEDLLRAEVFTPLAMTSCGYGSPATVGTLDAPLGHRVERGALEPVPSGPGGDNPPAVGPAGTVHCTLADWGRFAQTHLRGARHEAMTYLTPASFARMHTPPPGGDYALGWGVASRPWAGGVALTHQGSNTMFLATVWAPIARDRVLLVVTNAAHDDANQATEDALGTLIRAHVPAM